MSFFSVTVTLASKRIVTDILKFTLTLKVFYLRAKSAIYLIFYWSRAMGKCVFGVNLAILRFCDF